MTSVWERIGWTDPARREDALERVARDLARVGEVGEGHLRTTFTDELSPSELRAMRAASYGLTAPMIADLHVTTEATVRTQLRSAILKLKAKNLTHAVALCVRAGLV